jgi:membrane protease YdiL (CAAX protease family)
MLKAFFTRPDGAVRAPWRLLFFFLATTCGSLLIAGVVYPVIEATPIVAFARRTSLPLDQIAALLALLFGTYAARRIIDGERSGARAVWTPIGLATPALGWRALLIGLATGTFAILIPSALLIAAGRLAIEAQPALQPWSEGARVALVVLTPAALVEELAMRGYLLTTIRDALGAPAAVAITSVVFALLHLFNPGPTVLSMAMVACAGIFLATVRLSTGSLYAAWMAHLAWNLVQAAVLHSAVSGLPLPTPGYRLVDNGPTWLTGGTWGPEGGLAAGVGMLIAAWLMTRSSRGEARR